MGRSGVSAIRQATERSEARPPLADTARGGSPIAGASVPGSPRILRSGQLFLVALGFIALMAMTVVSVALTERNRDAFDLASHTQSVLSDTARSVELLEDAETGQRGFLLTEREAYLDPYNAAVDRIADQLDLVVAETAGLAIAADAENLRTAGNAALAEFKNTLALYRSDGRGAALDEAMTGRAKALMDQVRAAAGEIRANQEAQLRVRLTAAGKIGRILLVAQVGTALLVVIISLLTIARFSRNIRALRSAQGALAGVNANLEKTVEARTAALTQANNEIQRFAYIVSHDLRAPLVNILGFTGELERATQTVERFVAASAEQNAESVPADVIAAVREDVPEAFRFIKTSTAKMDRLIGAILTLSREGRRVLTPEPLQMRAVLEGIAATLKHRADEKGAEIVIQPLPNLTADRLAIEQIFGNLMDNAVKYLSPERPGVITVRGTTKAPFAIFQVEDNGRGIAPADQERVFELFRRAGQQTVAGEGIGLAYVRQLVYRLGGTIVLESLLSQGTTFTLTLPLVSTNARKDAA